MGESLRRLEGPGEMSELEAAADERERERSNRTPLVGTEYMIGNKHQTWKAGLQAGLGLEGIGGRRGVNPHYLTGRCGSR